MTQEILRSRAVEMTTLAFPVLSVTIILRADDLGLLGATAPDGEIQAEGFRPDWTADALD